MAIFKDSIFSINTNKNFESKIIFDFIYNQYESSETIANDKVIINRNDLNEKKKRFIRIDLQEFSLRNSDSSKYNQENYLESIFNLSLVSGLNETQNKVFNKIDQICPNRKHLINNLDIKEATNIINYYTRGQKLSAGNKSNFIGSISSSQRISINDDFQTNLTNQFLNTPFPEPDIFDQILDYNILFRNRREIFDESLSIIQTGNLFPKMQILEKTLSEIDFQKYSEVNAIKCGVLVEKFVKIKNNYEFLCSKFFTKDKESPDLSNLDTTIEDEAIVYGKTYRYMVSDVFLYTVPDPENRFVLNRYLLCDYPYISKDISCNEFVPPPPPNNLKFRYNKEKDNLHITWDEPKDYQDDAKGYQILRRFDLNSPFEVVAQLEGHLTSDLYRPQEIVPDSIIHKTPGDVKYEYIDKEYNPGKITIYCVRTIDAHGMFSKYSEQIAILYDYFEDKIIHDIVSDSGAKRNKPNEFVRQNSMFFESEADIVDNLPILKNVNKISLYVTPDFVQVKNDEEIIKMLDDKYQFTFFRLNDLVQYKKIFSIKNFNLEE